MLLTNIRTRNRQISEVRSGQQIRTVRPRYPIQGFSGSRNRNSFLTDHLKISPKKIKSKMGLGSNLTNNGYQF